MQFLRVRHAPDTHTKLGWRGRKAWFGPAGSGGVGQIVVSVLSGGSIGGKGGSVRDQSLPEWITKVLPR